MSSILVILYERGQIWDCGKLLRENDHNVGLKNMAKLNSHSNPRKQYNKNVCVHGQQESLDLVLKKDLGMSEK